MKRLLIALVAATLSACGGSGKLALQLTDLAPAEKDQLSQVVVTLDKVQAHVAGKEEKKDGDPEDSSIDGDDKWVTVLESNREFDLLQLQNGATAALGELELPEGKLTQIRLFIDTSAGATNKVVTAGGQEFALDLSQVPPTGVKLNHPFKAYEVAGGKKLSVVVDFDLLESIAKTSDGYRLFPVIKIKSATVKDD